MASDPRTVVRYPLASAALPLSKGAKHGLVRHAAHRAYEGLQADDNGKICSLLRMADDAASGPTSGESSPDRASRG